MNYSIEIPQFITHVAKTKNKQSPNKYIKINNQAIYNGGLNKFARAIAVDNLHNYLIAYIQSWLLPNQLVHIPYQIALDIHVPINYGDVKRLSKNGVPYLSWKEPDKDYEPRWDIGNLGEIWLKVFEDALQLAGVIENDNVKYITKHGPVCFYEVDHIDKRKLVFKIKEVN